MTASAEPRPTVRLGPRSLGRTRYRYALLGLAFAVAVGYFGYFAYGAATATERARQQAERDMRNVSAVMAEYARNVFDRAEFAVLAVAGRATAAMVAPTGALDSYLAGQSARDPRAGRLYAVDAAGNVIAAGDAQRPRARLAIDDALADLNAGARIAISKPIRDAETGGVFVYVLAPVPAGYGVAIALELPALAFVRALADVEDSRATAMALVDPRGWLIVRAPAASGDAPRQLDGTRILEIARAAEEDAPSVGLAPGLDGVERLIVARKLPGLDHIVYAGVDPQEFVAEWRESLAVTMPFTALVALAFLLLLLSLARHLGRVEDSEASLRESERRFQTLVGNVPGIVFQRRQAPGRRAEFVWINEGVERQLGIPRAAAIRDGGRALNAYTHPDDLQTLRREFARSAEDLAPMLWTGRVQHAQGGQRWFEIACRPRREEDGVVVWDGIALDVTERKRTEEALAQLSAQLEAKRTQLELALANMAQGIAVYDRRMRLVLRNRRYLEIFGLEEKDAPEGTSLIELLRVAYARRDEDAERIKAALRARIAGARARAPRTILQRTGDGKAIEIYMRPIDGGGHVATFTDVSAREEAAEALREAKEAAELADRAKSQFLANMSHELRTPLNAIIGFAEIMIDQLFGPLGDPRYAEYARDIGDSGKHLLNLINDILDLSKIEAREASLREEQVDLGGVVESCVRLMRERAARARLDLRAHVEADAPVVWADRIKLKQIVLNLLSNAVKFTPENGRVEIETGMTADGGSFIRVRDTGIGMRAADIPIALQPFRQIESTLARAHQGTGLGLPLSLAIARMHGGTLDVESAPDLGTTVTLRLPAERSISPAGIAPGTDADALPGLRGAGT
ncbi:MAG: PAS-domain containing protein [Azospirillum sp.]|nr:PAS-domain containing protein [Azospirillum sp.]